MQRGSPRDGQEPLFEQVAMDEQDGGPVTEINNLLGGARPLQNSWKRPPLLCIVIPSFLWLASQAAPPATSTIGPLG